MQWLIQHAEIIGTVASICVLLSFLQTGEKRIRTFNIIGAVIFVIYGLLIQAHSVWILNAILIGIQIYKIHRIHKQKKTPQPTTIYRYDNVQFQKVLEEVNKE